MSKGSALEYPIVTASRVVFTVLGESESPQPIESVEVEIAESGLPQTSWRARVNGVWRNLSSEVPTVVETDAMGQVVIDFPMRESMWVPAAKLYYGPSFKKTVLVSPTGTLRGKILQRTRSGEQLQRLRDPTSGHMVFESISSKDADNLSKAIQYLFNSTVHLFDSTAKPSGPLGQGGKLVIKRDGGFFDWIEANIAEPMVAAVETVLSPAQAVVDLASHAVEAAEIFIDKVGDVVELGIEYVIDGISYGLKTDIRSSVEVFDTLAGILHAASSALGDNSVAEGFTNAFLDIYYDVSKIEIKQQELIERFRRDIKKTLEKIQKIIPSNEEIREQFKGVSKKIAAAVSEITDANKFPEFNKSVEEITVNGGKHFDDLDPYSAYPVRENISFMDVMADAQNLPFRHLGHGLRAPKLTKKYEKALVALADGLAGIDLEQLKRIAESITDSAIVTRKVLSKLFVEAGTWVGDAHKIAEEALVQFTEFARAIVASPEDFIHLLEQPVIESAIFEEFLDKVFPLSHELPTKSASLLELHALQTAIVLTFLERSDPKAFADDDKDRSGPWISAISIALFSGVNIYATRKADSSDNVHTLQHFAGLGAAVALIIASCAGILEQKKNGGFSIAAWALCAITAMIGAVEEAHNLRHVHHKTAIGAKANGALSIIAIVLQTIGAIEENNASKTPSYVTLYAISLSNVARAAKEQFGPGKHLVAQAAAGVVATIAAFLAAGLPKSSSLPQDEEEQV